MTKEQQQDWLDALDNFSDDMGDILDAMRDLASRIDATVGEMKSAGIDVATLSYLRHAVRTLDGFADGDVDTDIAMCRGDLKFEECEE